MYRFCISILLMSSVFFSTSYAEDWVCVDSGDNSVYKVKIDDDVVSYIYPDNIHNETYNVYKHGRDDIVYAIQPLRLYPAADRQKFCLLCLGGGFVAIDKEQRIIHRASFSYGFRGEDKIDIDGIGEGHTPENVKLINLSWASGHNCQIDF
jgi:hypothetical protein